MLISRRGYVWDNVLSPNGLAFNWVGFYGILFCDCLIIIFY